VAWFFEASIKLDQFLRPEHALGESPTVPAHQSVDAIHLDDIGTNAVNHNNARR
jgi:hypothetical protein